MSKRPSLTEPRPGLVIRYAYLWRDEAARGQEEGKHRPCAVVLAARRGPGDLLTAVVAPVTHAPPNNPKHAIEIPAQTKRRLGLDEARSWIKTDELNMFTWPGPDLRPIGRAPDQGGFVYGLLPRNMIAGLIRNVRDRVREGRAKPVRRDELPLPSKGGD